uniref:Uncharacterized protein n=1 Tax=Anguilla anguilla TaxID=7936 RepID=A0A0E9TPK2_ANGAN
MFCFFYGAGYNEAWLCSISCI